MRLGDAREAARGYFGGWMDPRVVHRSGVRVLCYHGVVERKVDLRVERNQHLLSRFISQVEYMRRFRILSLPGLLDELASSSKPKAPAAVITFDDACANSLMAAEVLGERKIPWFLFVPAGEVGQDRAMWTVDLSLLMLYGKANRVEVKDRAWSLASREERETAFQFLRHMLKSMPAAERKTTMECLRQQFPAGESARLVDRFPAFRMLSWAEIQQLANAGVEIGSHGLNHEIHHDFQPAEARTVELVESRRELEEHLGRPCNTFAFPNGNFVASSAQEVAGAGYTLAFTTRPGTATPSSNRFLLPRLSAPGSLPAFVREYWWAGTSPMPPAAPAAAASSIAAGSDAAVLSADTAVPPIDSQREFYNERWSGYEFANSLKLARAVSILESLALTKLREPRIVDLGCGSAWLTAIVGTFGPAIGVELSDEAVKTAAARYGHIGLVQSDIFAWKYPRQAFDIVISQEVIEHVPDQAEYLRIAHDLLKSGGFLILTTPNAETMDAMEADQSASWSQQPIESLLSRGELRRLLRPYFRVKRLSTIVPNFGVAGVRRFLNSYRLRRVLSLCGLGDVFDAWRLRLGYGLHTIVVARKR